MKKLFDAVIFDFDGTVADTGKGVFSCIKKAIGECSLPALTQDRLRTFIGPPLHDSFRRECHLENDEETVNKLVSTFRKHYSGGGIFEYDIYDGLEELLSFLKGNGILTGIGSSKPENFVKIILEESNLLKYFDAVVGSDPNMPEKTKSEIIGICTEKLKLSPSAKVLMVGDRLFDIQGAHEKALPCAAVLYGYGSREEFEEYKADYIVGTPEEIKNIVIA